MLIFFLPNAIREVYFIFKDIFEAEGYSYSHAKAFIELILFIKDLNIPLKTIAVYNQINGTTPARKTLLNYAIIFGKSLIYYFRKSLWNNCKMKQH